MRLDEIDLYLPKYLSGEAYSDLLDGLDQFPDNIDKRLYGQDTHGFLLQGDGIRNLPIIKLPNNAIKPQNGLILSNTCDISTDNERVMQTRITYCPIFNLKKYAVKYSERKKADLNDKKVTNHLESIRKQRILNMVYLPSAGLLENESFAHLDFICSCDVTETTTKEWIENRLFTLSDYGFYLFLCKISIHFTRIRERVERS